MIDVEEARQYYVGSDSAHDFNHVLRVWRLAKRIGRCEGADMELVEAAALLHDVARAEQARTGVCHAMAGARRARVILKGQDAKRVERVAIAISEHRFRTGEQPSSLEARVLYDADKLDAIGAIGVARAYAVAGQYQQLLWADAPALANDDPGGRLRDPGEPGYTPVHEYRYKLSKLGTMLFTRSGREIARQRDQYMAEFFQRLELEVRGRL